MGIFRLRVLDGSAALALGVVLAISCWPVAAWGDAASPWWPGEVIGEPSGAVAHVAITHEDLALDLRPLAHMSPTPQPVRVSAIYQVRNDAAATTAPLVFLADRAQPGTSNVTVTVDDTALAATATELRQIPDAWRPPKTTPSVVDGSALEYQSTAGMAFAFTAVIPPGPHRLAVSYAALPGRYVHFGDQTSAGTAVWQIGYVLAPARQWASFGDLSIRVLLPTGWRAHATPELIRAGDELVGQFSGLPADSLALSAAYPVDPHFLTFWELLAPLWPLCVLLLAITMAAAAAVPGFTTQRWPFILSGPIWAVPALWLWMARGYVTPPADQYVIEGKFDLSGCAMLPGALMIAGIAAAAGLFAVAIPMFVGAAIWARVRSR